MKQAESVHRENRTRRLGYRLVQLRSLHTLIVENTLAIIQAAKADSGYVDITWQGSLCNVLNVNVEVAQDLLKRLEAGDKHGLEIVAVSSVLVLGAEEGMLEFHCAS